LADRLKSVQRSSEEAAYINDFADRVPDVPPEEWKRIKEGGPRRYIYFPRSTTAPSPTVESQVEELLRRSESQPSFRDSARSLSVSIQSEASAILDEPLRNRIASFSGQEDAVPGYVTHLLERIAAIKVLYLTERREPIGRREAKQLLELKIKRGGPEKLRTIQQTVSSLLGVEIDAFQAETTSASDDAGAELDVDRFLVQVNGAGIREALRLLLDYEFSKPDILLVEEPEIHLHPALETSMMRYMKKMGEESQIFITTHSTNFLDTAEMRNVYLVSKNGETNVQLINMSEAQESIPRELGIRLSAVFMFDRLVFVEGPTDEDVLREWASILNINLAQMSVSFVPMGGVRNLAAYATEQTISFLSKRQVRLWFVIDRDERDEAEVQKLIGSLGNRVKTCVLTRRELENYLVVPRAISEFVRLKRELSAAGDKTIPSEREILKAIGDSADLLKHVAVERRVVKQACSPIYPDRKAILNRAEGTFVERVKEELSRQGAELVDTLNGIEEIIKNHTRTIDENWATRKTEVVPGDLLLDEVCKQFGVRFNKERDSSRLAGLMKPDEVAIEIRDLLRELSS